MMADLTVITSLWLTTADKEVIKQFQVHHSTFLYHLDTTTEI
jgi:hypothetical protein